MVWVFVRLDQVAAGRRVIEGEKARHLARVLRIRQGERGVAVSDGREHVFEVVQVERDRIQGVILETHPIRTEPPVGLTLLQALLPHPDFDAVLEATTAVGATRFIPVLAERSVARLRRDRRERWEAVVESAAAQSHRGHIPQVLPAMSLNDAVRSLAGSPLLVPHPAATDRLNISGEGSSAYALAIGPEGGWTNKEIDILREAGGQLISLGPRILRARLAGVVAAAILIHHVNRSPMEPGS